MAAASVANRKWHHMQTLNIVFIAAKIAQVV